MNPVLVSPADDSVRVLIVLTTLAALVALFLLVRPQDDAGEASTTTRPPTVTVGAPRERPKISEITIRDGGVVGGRLDARAQHGDLVELRIFADVEDDVHLHGYDLKARVTPTKPARLRFRATITGRFEVELEERHLHIGQLTIVP